MADLKLELIYNVEKDEFAVNTNCKDPIDIAQNWIRQQMGKGEDKSPRNEHEEYNILIEVDLSDDTFTVSDNCGNKGLRDGIIMHYIRKTSEEDD